MRGTWRAILQQAPDLADFGPLAQDHALLGEADGGAAGASRPVDGHRGGAEVRLRPGLPLEALVPGDHSNPAPGEAPEQGGAPAFPVEDQRQGGLAGVRDGEVRCIRAQHAQFLQRGQDVLLQRVGHGRIQRLVQAQERLAAERVDPVARGGRQAEFLARHVMLGQFSLAAGIHLDVAIHRQGRTHVRFFRHPSRGQGSLPVPHPLHVSPQRLDLAPQRLHLRAAVQAQDGAPFPGRLVPQCLRIAHPGQGEEGQEQQNRGQTVVSLGQRQELPRAVQKPLPEQHRQPGQHAAASNHRQRLRKLRPHLRQMSRCRQHPPRRVPGAPTHRRLAVACVPFAPLHPRLRRCRRLWLRRRCRLRRPGPARRPPSDNTRPAVEAERARPDPQLSRNRPAAQPRGQKPLRLPRRRGVDRARPAPPSRRKKTGLALPP